jgi:hypothetical protein
MESSSIQEKILFVLSKTKEALLADVKSEFLPLRSTMEKAAGELSTSDFSLDKWLDNYKMVIEAIFTQVGYDISQLKSTTDFVSKFSKVFSSVETLFNTLGENNNDTSTKIENVLSAVNSFTGDLNDLLNAKTEYISKELDDLSEGLESKIFNRTLIKRILEHILITLLKNIRVVFADEIELVRMIAESKVKSVEDFKKLLEDTVKDEMSDAYNRLNTLCDRIGKEGVDEVNKIIAELKEAEKAVDYQDIVRIMNCAYSILSFFGLIKEKTIELKVPKSVLSDITKASAEVNKALTDINKEKEKAVLEVFSEIDKNTAVSQVAITTGVMNVGVAALADTGSCVNEYINDAKKAVSDETSKVVKDLKAISIPVKILVFRWECFPKLFTTPIDYLQDLYPIKDVDDAQQLLERIVNVARAFNPNIPDYSSLKNLLYSLLKQLEDKFISKADDNIKKVITEVKAFITLLEKVAQNVKENLSVVLETYKNVLLLLSTDLSKILQEATQIKGEIENECTHAFNSLAEEAKKEVNVIYTELKNELPQPNLKIDYTSLVNDVKSVIVADINRLASDGKTLNETDINGFFTDLDKKLEDWSTRTCQDIYKKVSSETWNNRFDNTFSLLQTEFGNDMQVVSKLFSKKGAKDLISDFDGTTDNVFTQLDITDYVHIITTAVEEVALPDPVRYYDDFRINVFEKSLSDANGLKNSISKCTGKTAADVDKILNELPSQIWDKVRKEVVDKFISYIKEVLQKALRTVLRKYLNNVIEDIFKSIDLKDEEKKIISSLGNDINAYLLSGMKFKDTVKLVVDIYNYIPSDVKKAVGSLLPDLPSNDFFDYIKEDIDVKLDLDNSFFVATIVDANDGGKTDDVNIEVKGKIQVCAFIKDGGLYIYPVIDAATKFDIYIGNYKLSIGVEGGMNTSAKDTDGKDMIGLCFKEGKHNAIKGSDEYDLNALSAWITLGFGRKENSKELTLFDTKYLGLTLKDFPQLLFCGCGGKLPEVATEGVSKKTREGFLDFGYKGMIKDAEVIIHTTKMGAFFAQVFKDDVKVPFSTYIWYDLRNGFDFGGDASLKIDVDLNKLKIGNVTFDKLDIDCGFKGDKLFSNFAQDLSIDFKGMVLAFEGLGLDLNLKGFEFGSDSFLPNLSLELPSFTIKGAGLTIDCAAVQGSGLISYKDGIITGVVQLTIVKKFGMSGFVQCDMGTAKGHNFNLVVLMSAYFSPGIPLDLGFSVTAAGGVIGLNRKIDRNEVSKGCRNGTLGSVFFVQDVKSHLAEMESSITSYFPTKTNQFFFGMLAQISYEPVVRVSFGLLLQLPKPVEIIIVGAVNVSIKGSEDIVQINVYFAGGINFEEGIWFDASIVDSHVAGIELFGDMAFRLFWGGETKGFLISIGGFHPSYTPEKGLMVSNMKRVGMQLKMSPLKLSFETYLAVTSNTFQIGARLDIFVGWNKFNISGYASFDCLFQFDPFKFMFDLCAGVAVKIGKIKILSIDLSMNVIGPSAWHIKGKAKFTFLLIPIPVSFGLTIGKDKNALPSEPIEVYPLLQNEIQNQKNWTAKSNSLTDNMVLMCNLDSDRLIVQPCDTILFSQSVVPFCDAKSDDSAATDGLQKMEVFNGKRPSDYDYISVEKLEVGTDKEKEDMKKQDVKVDFAPSLFKNLSIKEKLKSPSYEKWSGGFSLEGTKECVPNPNAEFATVVYECNSNPKTLIINGNENRRNVVGLDPGFIEAIAHSRLGRPNRVIEIAQKRVCSIHREASFINAHHLNRQQIDAIRVEKLREEDEHRRGTEHDVDPQLEKSLNQNITDFIVCDSAYARRDKASFERYMNSLDRKLQKNRQLVEINDL